MNIEKRGFYRQYIRHYGQKLIEISNDDAVIDDMLSRHDLGALFNALRDVIGVDWLFESDSH